MTHGVEAPRRRLQPGDVARLVDDRPGDGVFRIHRDALTDPALFALEQRHVFEATWVFLGLESQIARPHDFFTTHIGRHPVIVARDGEGRLGAFLNTCRHRSALVCHLAAGNRKHHVCHYHGWAYDSGGRNLDVKDRAAGAYPAAFEAESHDLVRVPRFAGYRGLLFGSLSEAVPPLDAHLGEARALIDLVVDQSPDGIELVPGTVSFTFDANWKLQIENGVDVYHFASTHLAYLRLLDQRRATATADAPGSAYQGFGGRTLERGSFDLGRGHSAIWGPVASAEARPLWLDREALAARVGETRARWMLYTRNLTLWPNMQLAENASLQLRVIRPLAVDRTEVTAWCVAPKGESAEARRRRLRQYEDFFNPSGLATPDDTVTYEDCQAGFGASSLDWQQGHMRGMAARRTGPGPAADELGIAPEGWVQGPFTLADETVFHGAWREWRRLLLDGMARDAAAGR